jgi:hypothetical protein
LVSITTVARADEIQIVKKGQTTPFDGILYSNNAHALLVSKTKILQESCKLKLDYELKKKEVEYSTKLNNLKIENEVLRKKLKITSNLNLEQRKYLLKQLEYRVKIPWYKSWQFASIVSVIVTLGLGALSVWGATEIVKNNTN